MRDERRRRKQAATINQSINKQKRLQRARAGGVEGVTLGALAHRRDWIVIPCLTEPFRKCTEPNRESQLIFGVLMTLLGDPAATQNQWGAAAARLANVAEWTLGSNFTVPVLCFWVNEFKVFRASAPPRYPPSETSVTMSHALVAPCSSRQRSSFACA